ncbi:MAG: DUF4360 domain-containing protein [Bdellovibrionota bacterium]
MILRNLTRIGLFVGFGLGALNAMAFDLPDPDEIYINNVIHGGSGCPQGSVAFDLSEDGQAFTLLFDSYVVESGPGLPRSESRKSCQLTVNLHVPQGWSYSIMDVDYVGFADLDRGTWGKETSTYYFQGSRNGKATLSTKLRGPMSDDYQISDRLGLEALVWSPCGVNRALNIKTSIQTMAKRGKSALMTLDSIDGEVQQIYGIKWKRCRH